MGLDGLLQMMNIFGSYFQSFIISNFVYMYSVVCDLGALSRSAQRVPQFDRLLRCVDHVHPVLQLRAPGVHEGTQHQHSQQGRRLWEKNKDLSLELKN